jgi:hypothetical protein
MLDYDESTMIRVWRFKDAPQILRELSQFEGGEAWLALVPPRYPNSHFITWIAAGPFGHGNSQRIERVDGSIVYIGERG